jgi:predicted ATPase
MGKRGRARGRQPDRAAARSVTDPAAVLYALATAMDLAVGRGDVLAACLAVLGERPALLVVDNC